MDVIEVYTEELIPYANNPRNNDSAVDAVANSIKEFGFKVPIVIDRNNFVVAGHTRLKAAKKLGLDKVPVVVADDLTDEQVRAFRLADNKVSELATWDMDKLNLELEYLEDFEMKDFGFKPATTRFDRDELEGDERQEGNEEYNEFLDKFELKKTTDDCYTPELVYNAVADYVARHYNLDKKNFVRPFYPGGDYKRENYRGGKIVVDNPPFSILSEIVTWYEENEVPFFLFAPHLLLFGGQAIRVTAVITDNDIIYENGACVSTSFLTNMDPGIQLRTDPELWRVVDEANKENLKGTKRDIPKYRYPDEVVTSAMLGNFSRFGEEFELKKTEVYHIRHLDAQKEVGKSIYGSGFLIPEHKAKEKAEAAARAEAAGSTAWELSEREQRIIQEMS